MFISEPIPNLKKMTQNVAVFEKSTSKTDEEELLKGQLLQTSIGNTREAITPKSDKNDGQQLLAPNSYVVKKTVSQGMLDLALLFANASQLKNLFMISADDKIGMHYAVIVMLFLSIVLQTLTGILLTLLGFKKMRNESERSNVETLNNVTVAMTFVITALNVVINAFAIDINSK